MTSWTLVGWPTRRCCPTVLHVHCGVINIPWEPPFFYYFFLQRVSRAFSYFPQSTGTGAAAGRFGWYLYTGIYIPLFCHVSCSCPSQEVVEQAEPNAPSQYDRQPKPYSVQSKAAETTSRHFQCAEQASGGLLFAALLRAGYCTHRMRERECQNPPHVSQTVESPWGRFFPASRLHVAVLQYFKPTAFFA